MLKLGKVIADLSKPNQVELVLKGGRGGRGNQHFATSTRQVPRFAEDGEKGEEKEIILELKLLADVGLLGFPNVGKSTFLSVVTDAKPKIANYHFTTLEPNLGVVKTKNGDGFVIAEGSEGRNPVEDFYTINKELKKYSEKLSKRRQIIVANKIDVMQDDTLLKEVEKLAKTENLELFKISAATKQGIEKLIDHVSEVLKTLPKEELIEVEDKKLYTLDDEEKNTWEIKKENGVFKVTGKPIQRLIGRINIEDNESFYYLQKSLRDMGVDSKLREMGICEGDTVVLEDWEFEWED